MEALTDQDFIDFIRMIRTQTGIDLSFYKEAQMKRRLITLRDKRGFKDFVSYAKAALADSSLMAEFLDRMTINVSEFFRNAARWEILEKKILPELLRSKSRLKCWSAACSTGEEPYTLAMILSNMVKPKEAELLATDLDDGVLQKAMLGVYTERSIREIPQNYMKFLRREGSLYYISDEIKQWVTFQKQNLLNDEFEIGYDLIVCRNVMIYFTEPAKNLLYHKFSQALRPGSILFIGSTEQIFHPEQFGLEIADTFFYRKK
jgi:chemotaxis protein methyltransferase CheR